VAMTHKQPEMIQCRSHYVPGTDCVVVIRTLRGNEKEKEKGRNVSHCNISLNTSVQKHNLNITAGRLKPKVS
jgi:hypothetical protein